MTRPSWLNVYRDPALDDGKPEDPFDGETSNQLHSGCPLVDWKAAPLDSHHNDLSMALCCTSEDQCMTCDSIGRKMDSTCESTSSGPSASSEKDCNSSHSSVCANRSKSVDLDQEYDNRC